jgi:hypothetical protein
MVLPKVNFTFIKYTNNTMSDPVTITIVVGAIGVLFTSIMVKKDFDVYPDYPGIDKEFSSHLMKKYIDNEKRIWFSAGVLVIATISFAFRDCK